MSKRKARIAFKDQRDFRKFFITVGIIVLMLIVLVYVFFQAMS
jgi:hypothetical protein